VLKVLDLFSGIGGFSLGLERAGMETVAFCEIDKKARLVLNKHWPDVPVFDDVSTLTRETLDARGISVDVICGGFPCQDISLAGKGAGLEGDRSGLWFQFHRLIKEIQPHYAIIENVSALRNRGLDQVLGSLAEIGYDAEWHCIPASAVGAPHRRDRIWIVAYPCCKRCKEGSKLQSVQSTKRAICGCPIMAYPNEQHRWGEPSGQLREGREAWKQSCGGSAVVADTMQSGLQGQWQITSRISEELKNSSYPRWWAVEPAVGRVANGVPSRVDRLKQLGNAVVPQIPELIGSAIIKNMGVNNE
jgi:DNA (cytosine-5)-methyltransferase 1